MPFETAPPPAFRRLVALGMVTLATTLPTPLPAAERCEGRQDVLGTARTLAVDTSRGLFVGTKSYPGTLPLGAKEIVLTFDDGPMPKTTPAVLAALSAECVKATFFVVGRQAKANPDLLRRIRDEGHTVAHHSMTHPVMTTLPHDKGRADIEAGWRAVDRILIGREDSRPATPFFRFPGFAPTPELSAWLEHEGVGVFGADLWGSDWNPTTPEALLAQVLGRLDKRGSGIVLLHDIHAHTAAMVPPLLKALKARGYRVVHIVPSTAKAD